MIAGLGAKLRRRAVVDEAGASLIMAMIVMMMLTTLSMALLGRTLSTMNFIRNGQDYDAALASADAALADALFKIDQKAPASWTASCPAPNAPPPCGALGGSFKYWAVKYDESRYVVSAIGTVGQSSHAIQALVTRSAQFPYALFSDQELRFNGTTGGGATMNFYSFNRLFGQPDRVRVGSNDTVKCAGPPDPNVYIDWGETQSECVSARVTQLAKKVPLQIPTAVATRPCPVDGIFGPVGPVPDPTTFINLDDPNVFAATPKAYVDAGTYVCERDVVLRGLILPQGGEVRIFVLPSRAPNGDVVAHHSVDISSAIVNPHSPARNFQLFKAGNMPMVNNGNTSSNMTFRGVIYAPETTMTINGGVWWAGSFTFAQLDVNGGPNVRIGYDMDLDTYLGPDWRVSRYREIPSSEADPTATTTTTVAPTSSTSPSTTSTVPTEVTATTTVQVTASTSTTSTLPPPPETTVPPEATTSSTSSTTTTLPTPPTTP